MSRSTTGPSLVVAPLAEELRPLLRATEAERIDSLPGGALYRLGSGERPGSKGGHYAAVIGDGATASAGNLERLIVRKIPSRMLMLGIAGGLSPALAIGELVQAAEVVGAPAAGGGDERYSAPGDGLVASVDRVLTTAAEKIDLWRQLGEPERAVVDLESLGFARAAQAAGIDWAVVRAVSDLRDEDLPLDLAAASDDTGHVSRARVLRQLLVHPTAWREVDRLRKRLRYCAALLADEARRWLDETPHDEPAGAEGLL